MKIEKNMEGPKDSKKFKAIFYSIIALVVLFEVSVRLTSEHHAEHFFGDKIWGFWSIFGLIGCLLLIIICKGIGHAVLMKKEDYYD